MKLIVGLGNPGDKYGATRHNAGFWLVERLAARSGTVLRKDGKFQALVGRHEASGAWLVLPQLYMNNSGRPVQTMASFFKIQPADILVIHDELDLPPGAAKLKHGGGIAGHNGLKDISGRLASHDYWRLRLGIGRPAEKGAAVEYVLHKPQQEERAAIDDAIERALEVLPLVLAGDTQGAMLKLHTKEQEEKVERAATAQAAKPAPAAEAPPPRAQPAKPEQPVTAPAGMVAAPGPAATTTSIERPAEARKPAPPEPVAKAPSPETERAAQPEGKPGKQGAFSLLKKLLPGNDPSRKK